MISREVWSNPATKRWWTKEPPSFEDGGLNNHRISTTCDLTTMEDRRTTASIGLTIRDRGAGATPDGRLLQRRPRLGAAQLRARPDQSASPRIGTIGPSHQPARPQTAASDDRDACTSIPPIPAGSVVRRSYADAWCSPPDLPRQTVRSMRPTDRVPHQGPVRPPR